ncbi:hypothetical protein [Micromonospora thermarum]|uniref:Uncharacterized protein n=1 Tax=Micromonospora thermarum TaxID=2720024 RepID=A0ABX0ZEV1_9ACTN|nr:hypothetical protein [Micromonospora thermarum]NJP35504.1 hypothetical protein [Micromonospora thermarum]
MPRYRSQALTAQVASSVADRPERGERGGHRQHDGCRGNLDKVTGAQDRYSPSVIRKTPPRLITGSTSAS